MIDRLIRCIKCNQIFPILPSFEEADGAPLLQGIELSDEDLAYRNNFECSHRGHPREELSVDPDTFFSEKPSYEPNRVGYFEATNGQQRFLIKRTKSGLSQPARYEILPGKMWISSVDMLTQDEEIRRQLSADPRASFLPEEKVQRFIALLRDEVTGILAHNFSEEIEMAPDADVPQIAYAALGNMRWEKILARCAQEFESSELKWVQEFIQENRQPGEVLSLLVHRKMSILPQEAPAPLSL
jgi:hypothetical protein